ncbi:MAG TPA: hypothetical protein VFM14_10100 [Gemmatimonadales bacterium]|nr:hypothetical protein [Gemmatimonadales bacterium]
MDRQELAVFVVTTMEGGVMQSRTHRSLDAFDAGVRWRAPAARLGHAAGVGRRHRLHFPIRPT